MYLHLIFLIVRFSTIHFPLMKSFHCFLPSSHFFKQTFKMNFIEKSTKKKKCVNECKMRERKEHKSKVFFFVIQIFIIRNLHQVECNRLMDLLSLFRCFDPYLRMEMRRKVVSLNFSFLFVYFVSFYR